MPESRRRKPNTARKRRKPGARTGVQDTLDRALRRSGALIRDVLGEAVERLPDECRTPGVTEPDQAQELLAGARRALEEQGRSYADAMGSYSWLHYLRRVPDGLLAGRFGTSAPYRLALAEALTAATSVTDDFSERQGRFVVPPLTPASAEAVVRLCGLAGALSQVHSVVRRAGKGQRVRWFSDDLPWVVPDPVLDEAIEVYDRRVADDGGLVAGTRQSTFHPFFRELAAPRPLDDFLLSVSRLDTVTEVPFWTGPVSLVHRGHFGPGRFLVGGVTLDETVEIFRMSNAGAVSVPPGLSGLVLLLRALFSAAFDRDTGLGRSLPAVGYSVLPTRFFVDLFDAEVDRLQAQGGKPTPFGLPMSGEAALAEVSGLLPSLWPLTPGPVFRPAGDQTVVDIHSAGQALHRLLTVQNSDPPKLVNARAGHFEEVVQDAIDSSPWRPPDRIRKLRGRTLRIGKEHVTDVDAIAVRDRTLLLVSCKSIPHTPELDAGVHSKVRNVRTHLEQSDLEWRERLTRLRTSPIGDNFDFSEYEIVGVVCVPHVEFTLAHQNRIAFAAGSGQHLRAVSSLGELRRYLKDSGTTT